MNSKTFNYVKKVIITLIIIVICSPYATYAISFKNLDTTKGTNKSIMRLISKFLNLKLDVKEYNLESLKIDLQALKENKDIDLRQISDLINKLPIGEEKDILSSTIDFTKLFHQSDINLTGLIDKLLNVISSLLGRTEGNTSSLPVKADQIYMDAKTAVKFGGNEKAAKLHANVYMHVDENGNRDSDKWALLIHPFMLKGKTIANKVGPFYYEKGYNIIAPDLRGFGESEGSVALGLLESMDIYDWLVKLNAEYDVSQVIVHGISLGAATTNYLSGIDGFLTSNEAPTKIETKIDSIKTLKVVALVEDCGYVNMKEFANESIVMSYSGLTEENFDYYSNATNSLKYCDIPMLIIHGTRDRTVDPENAETVKNTVKGEVEVWMVEGGAHAFIIMGSNSEEYKVHVQEFIDKHGEDTEKVEKTQSEILENTTEKEEKIVFGDKLYKLFTSRK